MLSQKDRLKSISGKFVYEMLFYTGLRIGKLEALPSKQVDLRRQQITDEKALIYKTKDDWHLSTPKTKRAYRTLGIGQYLSEKLKGTLTKERKQFLWQRCEKSVSRNVAFFAIK